MADIQWFYAKSKVPICLAITDSFHFLNKLKSADILTEEEALELQADTRTVHRVVYECLCCIEDKDVSSQRFFTFLFQKSLLRRYPDLKPIYAEYIEGKYRYGIHSTADENKDPLIFAQEKVHICLTITDRFPFLHGLQDLTILSESESLKLQADERPVSRVIYESLSLIEKKDMKLNIVFEYIFQQCYLKLYPGLQDILQEPSGEFVAPFNGGQYPMFNIETDILEFLEHNKTYICEAVNVRFPFLHGLHDRGLLSHIQLLRLQADKKSTKEVLNEALGNIRTIPDAQNFFAYLLQEFYLKLYPDLHIILKCLNAALTLDICPRPTVMVKAEFMELPEQDSSTPSTELYGDENRDTVKQHSNEPSPGSEGTLPSSVRTCIMQPSSFSNPPDLHWEVKNGEIKSKGSKDSLRMTVRKCRMQPISYSEPPDLDWDIKNEMIDKAPENSKRHKSGKRKAKETNINALRKRGLDLKGRPELLQAPENSKLHKSRKRKAQETNINALGKSSLYLKERPELLQVPKNSKWHTSRKRKAQETNINALRKSSLDLKERPDLLQVTKPVTVRVEFPKQVFNEKFKVRCGDKTGIFKKKSWTGHSSKDLCIRSEGKTFSVMGFETYGGRGTWKSWKRAIQCEDIKLECLIKAGILKCPLWNKKREKGWRKVNN